MEARKKLQLRYNKMISFILVINAFYSFMVQGATLPQVGVITDPSVVQQEQVTMKIYTQLVTQIPANGRVDIILPQEMALSTSTFTCTMNLPSGVTAQCTQTGSNKITAKFNTLINAGSFELQINNAIKNPTSTTPTSSFQVYTYSGTGQVIDQLTTGINLVATVGSFVSSTLVSEDQRVGVTTNLVVRFTPNHRVPANGQIKMNFPKWNPESITDLMEYLQGAVSCSSNSPALQSGILCSFANSVLTVTNLATKDIPGGIEISFKVLGFRNPLSTALVSGFQILTTDQAGGTIDISSSGTLKISQPAQITQASFTVDPSTIQSVAGIVGETNIMQVAFSSPVPLNQGCQIIVTLPAQFNLQSINTVTISGLLGIQRDIQVTKSGLQFSFSSCSSYTSNQLQGIIKINSLTLPGYAKATSNLNIEIKDKGGNFVAATSNGPTFTPIAGTGLAVSFSADPDTILSKSELTVTVKPQRTIGLIGQFVLQYNDKYTLSPGTCSNFQALSTSFVNSGATCSFSNNQLILTNFVSQTVVKGSNQALSFKVSTVGLPSTLGERTFQAWIKQQDSSDKQFYNIESFNGPIPHKMTYGTISATVTPAIYTAYENTIYTFAITPQHRLELNGIIVIEYPKNITIPDSSFSQSQCKNFQGFPSTPTCVIDTNSRTITINNGFRASVTRDGVTYKFSIPGVVNPLTLDPTQTFKFWTKTQDQSIMDALESGLTLKMTTVPFIKSVIVTPASSVNSAITSYTFLITPTIPVNNTYSVILKFPPEVGLPKDFSTLKCTSEDTSLIQSVQCTNFNSFMLNAVRVVINVKSGVPGINPLQTFKLTLNNIVNPPSTKPSSTFEVQIVDAQLGILSTLNTAQNPLTVMTNTPYTMTKATFTANTTGAGQVAKYTIQIFPEHVISKGGGVLIIYPSQIGVQSTINASILSLTSAQSPTVQVEKSARRISIIGAFNSDQGGQDKLGVTLTLEGFVNPLYNTEKVNSFVVKTMNTENGVNYFIDQVTDGLILNSPCDYPCSTCPPDKPSVCLSCYQTSILNKLQGETCVSECSTGKFFNVFNATCLNCDPSCLACTDNAKKCTQCGVGNLLYLFGNTCKSDCPDGYVKDSTKNLCAKCVNNCKTCLFTDTTCTSCFTDKPFAYFYQQNCLQACPKDISVPLKDFQCGDCDPSCKTCSVEPTRCTSCFSHMRFDSVKNTCTSVCQEGLQIYDPKKQVCEYCDPNCGTCAGNTTTCTSCKPEDVLNSDNTCKSACAFDNQISIQGVCKNCELPCAQCKGQLNRCTKCQGDYLLYNTTCVQYCPLKYKADNSTRQCVYEGLICPEGFHVNEVGDGCIPNEFECPPGYIINQQQTACVPAPGYLVPFPFLFLSACLSILVLGSYIKDKFFTKVNTNLIALIGMQELLIYGLMFCYAGANELWGPFILSAAGLSMLITANIIFYLIYRKEIVNDTNFAKWCRMYPKTEKYVSLLTLLLNFKSIKLFYSGFYGLEQCLAQFEDPMKNFFRPMRMITYFSFIFVYIPIIAADILIFIQVEWGFQLLILGIESFILAILIVVLTIIEFRHPEKLLMSGDEQYIRIKPRSYNESNVMGALVDVDESTLIRTRMVDDDYEIQLRKKAFVQILNQVGKNYFEGERQGVHLGKDLDKCMTKFDENKLKLRRAFSLESIGEEESWVASGDESDEENDDVFDDDADYKLQRRYSFPLSPRSRATAPDPMFKQTILEIKDANKEFLQDNVYAECKPQDKTKEQRKKKTVSRRTQTYLRELLMMEGEGLVESDLEVVLDEDAEIDNQFAKGLINGVIDGLSDFESDEAGLKKKKKGKKKSSNLPKKEPEVPDFELQDIMGEFEIDDLGNFIILRGERGELLDKKERRVNRRGYLIDRFGNVINKNGQIIFKAVELDSDDEIPAPFGFEKRKKNLLSLGEDGEFKMHATEKQVADDEDVIERELKAMRKKSAKKGGTKGLDKNTGSGGEIVEEKDEGDESSVDSLMAESPAKYGQQVTASAGLNINSASELPMNEDELINKVTQKKIPKKKPPPPPAPVTQTAPEVKQPRAQSVASQMKKKLAKDLPKKLIEEVPEEARAPPRSSISRYNAPVPKRIKREDTKELFPSLAIESIEQKKLFKIAESIGGMANQLAEQHQLKQQKQQVNTETAQINQVDQDKLERLKQEHFKDIISNNDLKGPQNVMRTTFNQHSDSRLAPHRGSGIEKIYGNLGDVVAYDEKMIMDSLKQGGQRTYSPSSSQMTLKKTKNDNEGRRMTGLEAIYLQKFDKKQSGLIRKGMQARAKFRNTLQQFVDDPELLVDDGQDVSRQNEMSMMVAEKLDRLQRQYMQSTSSNRLSNVPITSMGYSQVPLVGNPPLSANNSSLARKVGSQTGLTINNDLSQLEPIKKGNWINQPHNRDSSLE